MRFEFAAAGRIIFGPGTIAELGGLARGIGRRAFVVTGRDKIRHAGAINDLEGAGLNCTLFGVPGEPTIDLVQEAAALFTASGCALLIAIGGGSALDAGKAIAALAANPGDALDYLEVIGAGKAIPNVPFPMIAVPTTAGTGSEVTRNAVLASPRHRVKVSLRSPMMLPRIAIVDPRLTMGLPPAITASTGLDALTQLIEPYVSAKANPMTDAFCLDGLRAVKRSLAAAYGNGSDAVARAGMSYASLLGGLALANAGLGVVHGFAGPIGGMFDAPHGDVCAAILPHGMAANIRAGAAPGRYREIAAILTGNEKARGEDGVAWVRDLVQSLGIPGLRQYGISAAHVEDIVEKASKASSMKANPVQLPREELKRVLEGIDLKAEIRIVEATAADVPIILELIRGLAEYEKLSDQVTATEEKLRMTLFGQHPAAEVLLGYVGDECAGFALFFRNYSTFLAKPGIFLEDLFVKPAFRGRGVGRALLTRVGKIAKERGCGRFEWEVLDWNAPAIGFYKSLGAVPMDEWTKYRVTGATLDKFGL